MQGQRIPIMLLDGGLGTTLQASPYNITFDKSNPLWSSHLLISSPSTLFAVHQAFIDAGADILLTATYQASFEGFARTGPKYTPDNAARYMRSAIPLARHAFSSHKLHKPARVALSLGPYGATMSPVAAEYSGEYPEEMGNEDALRGWHERRLKVFSEDEQSWNNVDYIAFETVKRADEVRAIRGVMCDVLSLGGATRKPWWVSGVFPTAQVDEGDVRQWVRAAFGTESSINLPRPWGIGINCTRVENLHRIVSIMKDELQRLIQQDQFVDEWQTTSQHPHLILYPNGTQGEEYDPVTKEWAQKQEKASIRLWDEVFSQMILEIKPDDWESVILGGCCRVMPQHIAALRQGLDCHQNPESDI